MEVTLEDVKKRFIALCNGELTRADADRWAWSCIQKFDNGELKFSPKADETQIWTGIKYLYGIDLQSAPGIYPHLDSEIADFATRILRLGKRSI